MPFLRGLLGASFLLILGCGTGAAPAPPGPRTTEPVPHSGHVTFADDAVTWQGGSRADRSAVREAAIQLLESWCALDAVSYRALLSPDVTRIHRVTGIARGPDAVIASLPREWEEMERPDGEAAVDLVIEDATIAVDGDVATALYAVDVTGQESIRWEFTDRWLLFQVFARGEDRTWRLLHQSLASDLDERDEDPSFDFDFAVPVADVARAAAFYTPLLGEPELVDAGRAVYRVGAIRYILDARGLGGFARVRREKPNGYALFPVARIDEAGVEPISRFATPEGDSAAVCVDPAGNAFVLVERRFASQGPAPVADLPADLPRPAAGALAAWLRADAPAFAAAFAPDGAWFDNTRSNRELVARGPAAIRRRAREQASQFDRSSAGLSARLSIHDLGKAHAGSRTVLTFRTRLEGTGPHRFRDDAYVVQVLDGDRITASFAVRSLPEALVREFDYIGYPTERLRETERFYRTRLGFGTPYTDASWFGFWGAHAVFGLFEADRAEEGFPEPRTANGYPSFWVASARRTEAYLRDRGSRFPVYPSINSRAGADRKPGYTDLLATDPDGNLILFTEYTGR